RCEGRLPMSHEPTVSPARGNQLAIDPVCGMTVDPNRAAGSVKHEGTTYYFCSKSCVAKFAANPEAYVRQESPRAGACCHEHRTTSGEVVGLSLQAPTHEGDATRSTRAKYICPMCPGVESDVPAACPKCGMALEPTAPTKPARQTVYTCP